jgi:hypothetical protein
VSDMDCNCYSNKSSLWLTGYADPGGPLGFLVDWLVEGQ